ncbi:MAG: O-antigen ligase family protein [Gaiellaceae bacterium]
MRRQQGNGLLDGLLLATVFTITFAKVRWSAGGADVNISDIAAGFFVFAFFVDRLGTRDWSFPRAFAVLAVFLAAFSFVYLIGYFNLETTEDRTQFVKGLVKFWLHFALVLTAVAYLARRGERFYWQTLGWFTAGFAANAGYGLLQLAVAQAGGRNLDELVLTPLGSYQGGGINVFGQVGGVAVYRTNALTLDPNHLGIMLLVPLLTLLPVYLRLERGHRLRTPLALLLGFLFIVELTTLSRSGLLGLAAGLLVLAVPYRGYLLSPRLLVPLGGVAVLLALAVAQRTDFFRTVLSARTSLSGSAVQTHLGFYSLLPPVLDAHPLFGLGLNTFSTYYEFVTGESNWGPHSFYVSVLTETGIVGALVFLAYLVYLFRRLGALRELGRSLARAGDRRAARVRPLAWGLTAALVGTLAANSFYLTMQMYYFFVVALLVIAAPFVFGARATRSEAALAPRSGNA